MTEHAAINGRRTVKTAAFGSVGREGSRFTIALICPSCGAGVSFNEGSTKVVCGHCGLSHMVTGEKGLLRYYIPNRKKGSEAAARVHRFLAETGMDKGSNGTPHFIDARLAYVPFFRVKVIGGGWYIGRIVGQVVKWTQTGAQEEIAVSNEVEKKVIEGFLKDLVYFTPAVDVSEMGLIGVWAKSMVLELVPFDREKAVSGSIEGEIYSAVKDHETACREAWATLSASARPAGMNLEYFEAEKIAEQITMIHYPVWIVRFLLGRAPRRIVVDGIGGDIIFAHMLKKRGVRAIPGILTLAAVALMVVTFPLVLVVPAVMLMMLTTFRGIDWFLSALSRFFVYPWDREEVVIG
jgi:ribosomal protein S27AE